MYDHRHCGMQASNVIMHSEYALLKMRTKTKTNKDGGKMTLTST